MTEATSGRSTPSGRLDDRGQHVVEVARDLVRLTDIAELDHGRKVGESGEDGGHVGGGRRPTRTHLHDLRDECRGVDGGRDQCGDRGGITAEHPAERGEERGGGGIERAVQVSGHTQGAHPVGECAEVLAAGSGDTVAGLRIAQGHSGIRVAMRVGQQSDAHHPVGADRPLPITDLGGDIADAVRTLAVSGQDHPGRGAQAAHHGVQPVLEGAQRLRVTQPLIESACGIRCVEHADVAAELLLQSVTDRPQHADWHRRIRVRVGFPGSRGEDRGVRGAGLRPPRLRPPVTDRHVPDQDGGGDQDRRAPGRQPAHRPNPLLPTVFRGPCAKARVPLRSNSPFSRLGADFAGFSDT